MSTRLPSAEQWIQVFTKLGLDVNALLTKIENEVDSYVMKLPTDPVARKAVLDLLDEETRRLVEAGLPVHLRLDTITSIIRDSASKAEHVYELYAMAAEELVQLIKTKRSEIDKQGIRLA